MKKGLTIFCLVAGIAVAITSLTSIEEIIRAKIVSNNIEKLDAKLTPTIDFVQPYLFDHAEGEKFDYDKYFNDLSSVGYDTLIVQMTRDELEDGSSRFYYPTSITSDLVSSVERSMEYILEEFLDECDKHDFDVYIGLSVEEYSWWALTCYYDETYMNHCANTDAYMVQEIYDQFNSHESFVGWYFAYELFSNPVGWERLWAKNVNTVIDAIDKLNDGRPILFSPFRQIILGNVTNEYLMWNTFFKKTHFRSGDIFCPQDSIGKLDSTDKSFLKIYDYIDNCSRAAEKAGLKFYVNCELFKTPDESVHLYVSDIDRVSKQIKNASRKAEKLVTFSASHYFLDQGSVDTLENRQKFFDDYKKFYNEVKK